MLRPSDDHHLAAASANNEQHIRQVGAVAPSFSYYESNNDSTADEDALSGKNVQFHNHEVYAHQQSLTKEDQRDNNGGRNGQQELVKKASIVPTKSKKTRKASDCVSVLEMFRFADKLDVLLLIGGTLAAIANGGGNAAIAIIIGDIYDALNSPDPGRAKDLAIAFMYIGIILFIVTGFQISLFTMAAERMTIRMREAYLKAILSQDISFFDSQSTGAFTLQVAENSIAYREALGEKLGLLFQYFAVIMRGVIAGLMFAWQLCLVIFALTPLLAVAGYITAKAMHKLVAKQILAYTEAGSLAKETLTMIRTVTAFNLQREKVKTYEAKAEEAAKTSSRQGLWAGLGFGLVTFAQFASLSLSLWIGTIIIAQSRESAFMKHPPMVPMPSELGFCTVGGLVPDVCNSAQQTDVTFETLSDVCSCPLCRCGCYHAGPGEPTRNSSSCVTGGDVVLTLILVMLSSQALGLAMGPLTAFANGRAAAAALYRVIDQKPDMDINSDEGIKLDVASVKGEIVFENVAFTYPSRRDAPVFRNLSMLIPAGKRVALVGESGSGKSTCIALLERFYDPDSGRIVLDGHDLRELNIKSLRSVIGLVSQEPILFGTSILENVRYGRPDATDEEVMQACRESNAHDFVAKFPEGYQTQVTSSVVSGGQKQRIAIARALLRNPPILLLDEATAALDNESERLVNEAIDRLLGSSSGARTTIVIAHRLSSIRACDRIYVLDAGEVVEEGSHEELMAAEGVYASMNKLSENGRVRSLNKETPMVKQHDSLKDPKQFRKYASFNEKHVMRSDSLREEITKLGSLRDITKVGSIRDSTAQGSFRDNNLGRNFASFDERYSSRMMMKAEELIMDQPQQNANGNQENEDSKAMEDEEESEDEIVDDSPNDEQDDVGVSKAKRHSVLKAFRFAWPDRLYFIPAVLGAVANGAMMPLFVYLFAASVDSFFVMNISQMRRESAALCLAFFGMALGGFIVVYMHSHTFYHIGGQMTKRARVAVFQHLLSMEIGFFDEKKNNVGALTSKLATDAAMLKAAVCDRMGAFTMNITTIIAGYVVALAGSWKVALVVTALFPALILAFFLEFRAMAGSAATDIKAFAEATETLSESIIHIRTVMAFNMQASIERLYHEQLLGPFRKAVNKGFYAGLGFGFAQGLPYFFYGPTFWFGSNLLSQGEISFRGLNQALLGILLTAHALGSNSTYTTDIAKGYGAVQSIFSLLERKSKIDVFASKEKAERPSVVVGDITFENVRFSYPVRPDVTVLDDFNLCITRGQTVAFVGSSGSGKSTLVLLLERFYDPQGGAVLLDGRDIRDLDVEWLRDQIGIVSQEPALFRGTIMENIRAGKLDATDEEVVQAAKTANAHDFIIEFPLAYHTEIFSASSSVSGGQKQRIAIARALIRNPKILLLDEATSALDEESQKAVQEALDALMKQASRTTIVVAHRLSTIRNADHIVVLQNGVVVEQGSFKSLMSKGGAFTSLLQAQESH